MRNQTLILGDADQREEAFYLCFILIFAYTRTCTPIIIIHVASTIVLLAVAELGGLQVSIRMQKYNLK